LIIPTGSFYLQRGDKLEAIKKCNFIKEKSAHIVAAAGLERQEPADGSIARKNYGFKGARGVI
jgi:hypothetical protein